ncbi:lysozyme g-like [Lampris incognitus]|uniref:lysozyme g-like n=1 Tax=Lampris incognitus TaxID=2546036 RepID=UPI0024B5FFAD|nr:lysozyme g-like [Lampris incognitus]
MDFGDITKIKPTGASRQTAQQDKLGYQGVAASHAMAQTDEKRMRNYKTIIQSVAQKYKIDAALIAAIISRESRAGNTIKDTGGFGDYDPVRKAYNAFGLMQVDINPNGGNHSAVGTWDSKEHLDQATGYLIDFIGKFQTDFSQWKKEEQLMGGIAAYNIGNLRVRSYPHVDVNTTGGDYANDVVARAQWYKKNGYP